MIQFNLLPDVKMEYVKARRREYLIILICTVVTTLAIALFVVLILTVDVVQKKQLSDLRGDVATSSSQLNNTSSLDEMLTVQNQLRVLPTLHNEKPAVGRLSNYLTQLTPTSATISSLDVDFTKNTITLSGSANSLASVNQFTDTLKFTGYLLAGQTTSKPAFSDVVLTSFGDTTAAGATYTITANFDPALFEQTNNVTLTVPGVINTRSDVAQPGVLFVQSGS